MRRWLPPWAESSNSGRPGRSSARRSSLAGIAATGVGPGEWSVASLRWCERQALSGFPGLCRFHRAEVMRFRGELDRAERDACEAVDELLVAAPRWAAWGLHELGEIRRRRGDLEGAVEAFRHSAELGFDPQPGLALLGSTRGSRLPPGGRCWRRLADENGMARESRWLVLPAAVEIAVPQATPSWRVPRSRSWSSWRIA